MGGATEEEPTGVAAAEQAAAMLYSVGMPRMPARVMMALVGSPDEGFTASDLASRLGVSPAAVSGAVRYLQMMRIIQRVARPGERQARYHLMGDGWNTMVTANAPLYGRLADFIDEIADGNTDAPAAVARARNAAGFFRYIETRFPQLVEEWEAQQGE